MLLTILVLATFVAALFVALVRPAGLIAVLPGALFAAFASLLPKILAGSTVVEHHEWVPSLGVFLDFRADALSLLLALLITGIGTCVFLYAATYLADHPKRPVFFAYLTMFMGAMLGAVLADNMVLLLIFWELTSLSSFLLIGFEHDKPQARQSAQQGLLVTVAGGLAMTAGIILLGQAAGTYRISEILANGTDLISHPFTPSIIVLIALGAFTKSAQTPFHFWLPNAMVAPTPVSAYLHSATMVKLGVYLLARLRPVFGTHELWLVLLVTAGSLTMLTGAILALRETDLKRILAYSTLAALGMLVSLIGLPGELAAVAMVTFLIVHALYKACLFLVAGIVDHEAGTRDASKLGGLGRLMPWTATAAGLGALSMAGFPPLMGFLGKELVYEAGLHAPLPVLAVGIALLANIATVVAAGVVSLRCFAGKHVSTPGHPHDPPLAMLFGPAILGLLGLLFGTRPVIVEGFINRIVEAMTGQPFTMHLALWHGLTPMLWLSLATFALGAIGYFLWGAMRRWLASRWQIDEFGPTAAYNHLLSGFIRFATWQTKVLQPGRLHGYLAATLVTVITALGLSLFEFRAFSFPQLTSALFNPVIILPILLIPAAIAVVRAQSFVAGIVAAGIVGFLMSLVYLFQGAPDLAFTQFAVEALSIDILLTIVGRMPFHEREYRTRPQRRRDAIIACSFGLIAACLLLAITASPFNDRLSKYYETASPEEAHGQNIVNVIIVDFRGMDTLGEITVLALAAIAASALISRRFPKKPALAAATGPQEMEGQ